MVMDLNRHFSKEDIQTGIQKMFNITNHQKMQKKKKKEMQIKTTMSYHFSHVRVAMLLFSRGVMSNSFAAPWMVACQAPLFTQFSRQEYWSGSLYPSSGALSHPRTELRFSALAGRFFTT